MLTLSTLTTVGASVRRRSRFEPLRSGLVAAAVFLFVMSIACIALTIATYSGWDTRGRDRSPVDVTAGQKPTALWAAVFDTLPDDTQYQVVYISALTNDTAAPQGLKNWPGPSEVALSPALADQLGATLGALTRYGTFTTKIQRDGLSEPHELLAYVGTDSGRLVDGQPVVRSIGGLGAKRVESIGNFNDRYSIGFFEALVVSFLVAPSIWLFANALRIGSGARSRRAQLAAVLGADRRQIRSLIWGELRLPWLIGALLATAALSVAALHDIDLPGMSFTLQARDVRAQGLLVVGISAAGLLVSALAARSAIGLKNERPYLALARGGLTTWLLGAACPVVAALAVIARNVALSVGNVELAQLLAIVGPAAALALLPLGATVWVQTAARWALTRARREGRAAALTGSAQLAARPRPAARFGATAAILIAATAVGANVVTNVIVRSAVEAHQMQAALGRNVALVQSFAQADAASWNAAVTTLSSSYAVAELRDEGLTASVIIESEADRTTFASSSFGTEPTTWRGLLAVDEVTMAIGIPAPNEAASLIITPRDGGDIDIESLRDLLGRETVPMWNARFPGGEWVSGAVQSVHAARWLTWLGTIGLAISLVALWAGYTNELRRAVRSLFAIQLLAPDSNFVRRALAWRIVAPVAVAVTVGGLLAITLSIPRSVSGLVEIPFKFIGLNIIVTLLTALVAWQMTWRACVRAVRHSSLAPPDE